MASLVAKKKGNQLYYYVVESARVHGQPRIVHQAYLGSAEKVAALVQDRTAPVPLSATMRDFGLPGALWLAAQQTGVFSLLESLWPQPRSSPSPAHYVLLAAIHRICQPGPKTEVSDWYHGTVLQSLWHFPPERFTSQAFWDVFEKILPQEWISLSFADDPLEHAQLRLLALWKEKQGMGHRRLLAYDTTNFYTYIASTNTRNELAQRGHNKQGRHNLRQVGLSYVLDGESGLSLCHHVYPGDGADAEEFSTALSRITRLLDHHQIARDTVTAGVRQRYRRASQHRGTGGGPRGMDLRSTVEPGPRGVAGASGRTTAAVQQPTTWCTCGGGKTSGAWQRVRLCGEVFSFLCRRATAQFDHQREPGAAVSAPILHGTE